MITSASAAAKPRRRKMESGLPEGGWWPWGAALMGVGRAWQKSDWKYRRDSREQTQRCVSGNFISHRLGNKAEAAE